MSEITYTASPETHIAIGRLIDATVAGEYGPTFEGRPVADLIAESWTQARAGLLVDASEAFVSFTGGDRGLSIWVDSEIRRELAQGLSDRECQCRQLPDAGLYRNHPGHTSREVCHRHYEHDVPELGGLLLCGDCHGAEWRAANDVSQ